MTFSSSLPAARLVRASAFCRPRLDDHGPRKAATTTTATTTTTAPVAEESRREGCCRVQLQILPSMDFLVATDDDDDDDDADDITTKLLIPGREAQRKTPIDRTVWVNTAVLKACHLLAESWAWLSSMAEEAELESDSVRPDPRPPQHPRRVLVWVEALRRRPPPATTAASSLDPADIDTTLPAGFSSCSSVAFISPLLALNLGWDPSPYYHWPPPPRPTDDDDDDHPQHRPPTRWAHLLPGPHHLAPTMAVETSTVTLLALARPLPTLAFFPQNHSGPAGTDTDEKSESAPPRRDRVHPRLWPLPPASSVLEKGTLLSVYHPPEDQFYYYQVVDLPPSTTWSLSSPPTLHPSSFSITTGQHEEILLVTTSSTEYRILLPEPGPVPRLPPLTWGIPPKPVIYPARKRTLDPSHPLVQHMVKAWTLTTGSSSSGAAGCIFHVVGTEEEHGLVTAAASAADVMGRRLCVVEGLAAHAHFCPPRRSRDKRTSNTVTTGGLMDRLLGLESALDGAQEHAPSLLLLLRMDREISSPWDAHIRHDEEDRLWAALMDQLSWSDRDDTSGKAGRSDSDPVIQVPPVVVVLATDRKLAPGPFQRHLVHESWSCSRPDAAGAAHFWSPLPTNESILRLLQGRPVHEILRLQTDLQRYVSPRTPSTTAQSVAGVKDSGPEEVDTALVLERLEIQCQQVDHERRQKSGLAHIPSVYWEDIGGLEHVRREILDAIELPLQYPHLFATTSGRRSGILLYGPPGVGKTLVAKAVATECNLPFLSVKGPELLGSFVGESEGNVRDIFDQARQLASQNQPPACVLFFDEIDSLAPRRGYSASGANVLDRVVATLLGEFDKNASFTSNTVFCLGATNRPDLLDPALLRPGRLDRLVYLGISPSDYERILAAQLRKLPLGKESPEELARAIVPLVPNHVTGADLSTIASGAVLLATERLCRQADLALEKRRESGEVNLTLDRLLDSWDEGKLQPTVTLDDLVEAARSVVPSVSAAEIQQYERLAEQFQMQNSDSTPTIPST